MPDRTNTNQVPSASDALQMLRDADSVPKMIEAVKKASFLENVPSPERQVLRATKKKLKAALLRETNENRRRSLFQNDDRSRQYSEKFLKSVEKFEKLLEEYEKLKWRLVKMPGGATRKADAYYRLNGLMKQFLQGDVNEAMPMFADNGNIDFHARFIWDAWTLAKGMSQDQAQEKFVQEFFDFPSSELYKDNRTQVAQAVV